MLEWQAELTGRYREPAERHRHQHALCTYTFNHTCIGRQAHRNAPHLPRYQNTASPDKLVCVRACQVLTLQVSVTFLSELHVVSHPDKESQKEPTCHPSLSLSLPAHPLFPFFLCWVLSNEAGIGSRSQHHMLHNSQSPVVIAEAFIKDSATTSTVWLWMKQGLMVSN